MNLVSIASIGAAVLTVVAILVSTGVYYLGSHLLGPVIGQKLFTTLYIGTLVIVLVPSVALSAYTFRAVYMPISDVKRDFLSALSERDFGKLHALLVEELRLDTTGEQLEAYFKVFGVLELSDLNMPRLLFRGGYGSIEFVGIDRDGEKQSFRALFVKVGISWKLGGLKREGIEQDILKEVGVDLIERENRKNAGKASERLRA